MKHSSAAWLVRGLMAGFLLIATLNALSYFFRSGWENLTTPNGIPQAIGFPAEMWRYGVSYDGAIIDWSAFSVNLAVAIGLGLAIAGILIWHRRWMNEFVDAMVAGEQEISGVHRWQFSLRSILVVTAAFAGFAGMARMALGAGPEMMLAIYLLGPTILVLIAMLPRNIAWQYRVVLLTPATLLTIAFAIVLGNHLSIPFDQVIIGIFVCWVPQTVIAAACLTVGLLMRYNAGRKSPLDGNSESK